MRFAELWEDQRRWGWSKSLYIQLMDLVGKYLGIRLYWIRKRPLKASPLPSLPAGLSIRILSQADLYAAAADTNLEMSPTFVDAAVDRGDVAFGVFAGDALVSYLWRSTGPAPHVDGFWVRVASQYRYGYKGFTLPTYRGQGLNMLVALFSDHAYLARNYTDHVSFVETHNFSSLALNKKKQDTGRRIGLAGHIKCLGFAIPFRTSGCKAVGFEFYVPQHDKKKAETALQRPSQESW